MALHSFFADVISKMVSIEMYTVFVPLGHIPFQDVY